MKTNLRACIALPGAGATMAITGLAFAPHQAGHKPGGAWKTRLLSRSPRRMPDRGPSGCET
jgi:hypothetical protein